MANLCQLVEPYLVTCIMYMYKHDAVAFTGTFDLLLISPVASNCGHALVGT